MKFNSLLLLTACFSMALGKVRRIVEAPAKNSVDDVQPPDNFNGTCFGCIVNGYRYCSKQEGCIPVDAVCSNKTNETSYTQTTGCPVKSQC